MATAPSGPIRPPDDSTTAPAAGPRKADFISDYADYADILEAPRDTHEVVAISLLAAVLNPNVNIPFGGVTFTLDLWGLILSGSGLGRNTLMSLAYPVLDAAGLSSLVRNTTWGSRPAFYEDIARNSTGLFMWTEFSQVLRTLSQPQFGGVKEWLTDRFDNARTPEATCYRTTRRKTSTTPPIIFSGPPRLNILATSSVDWFVSSLAREDTTGGFVPRWLIVRVPDTKRVIPKPEKANPELIEPLADHLQAVGKLTGPADLSLAEDQYEAWYRAARHRFERQPNSALAMPFFHRLRATVLKLAVIFEVSMSCTLRVSPAAMERVIAFAASTEATIFKLLPTGMTAEGFALDRIEQAIRQARAEGMAQTELTRAFQGDRYRDRKERLTTLAQAGQLLVYERKTSGRPAYIYVWSDFREQHEKDFPGDTLRAGS